MRMNKWQMSEWNAAIRKLRDRFDPGVPIDIQTRRITGNIGDSHPVIKLGRLVKVIVRIDSAGCFDMRFQALVHEWAHAMEWEVSYRVDGPRDVHSETWGVWYAKIYSLLYDEEHDEESQ